MAHPARPQSLETQAVHAGREVLHEQGIHAMPIDLSSTYPVQDLDEGGRSLEAMAMGGLPIGSPVYARLYNPTVARYEQALAQLEGAEECVAFGSGMAAVTASLMAAKQRGNHIVAVRPLYGGTDHLLASGMLGLEVTWAEADGIAAAIRPDTAMVIVETPANPTLALLDLEDVVRQAGKVPVLVDNTFATPVLQNPIQQGATLVLHSATKFLGGHGDVLAGLVATNNDWATELRKVRVITGNVLHPLAAYLLHRSLPTLPLRVRSQQAGAQILAERLAKHPAVSAVHFPGLTGQDPKGLLGRQMKGPGSLMAFELVGGFEAASVVMSEVKLMTPAVSLGSVDTLIQHPAALTHRVVNADAREHAGVSQSLMRMSVGLESPEDLWADLEQALVKAMARTAAHV
ncbi:MAG: aminotransferase class I/II-fold pyridoxal phosphate-dependent enzyme [Geothrix sp.]|uniref:trans-sulfuration enzyme family protein n=1 Tax=Geothrix sp. TaxID=1962974 RepID=UPI001796CB7A|nr:aminotransferase class I/II-fold pyridoxal phosphate-dependent enzyme [Geothrix sp.]NWJ39977.1 aminotransferase class I/II-fold pyridoxal phosphate-dependent enzyme [Geothrix sp.]WIL22012.1 MAG: aminotransferase class I/II-fold pyridoxal phosphate-dependent enzyme [Geothrix sp.]